MHISASFTVVFTLSLISFGNSAPPNSLNREDRQGILEFPKQIATIIRNSLAESLRNFFTTPAPPRTPSPRFTTTKRKPQSPSKIRVTTPPDNFAEEFIVNNFIQTTKFPIKIAEHVPGIEKIKATTPGSFAEEFIISNFIETTKVPPKIVQNKPVISKPNDTTPDKFVEEFIINNFIETSTPPPKTEVINPAPSPTGLEVLPIKPNAIQLPVSIPATEPVTLKSKVPPRIVQNGPEISKQKDTTPSDKFVEEFIINNFIETSTSQPKNEVANSAAAPSGLEVPSIKPNAKPLPLPVSNPATEQVTLKSPPASVQTDAGAVLNPAVTLDPASISSLTLNTTPTLVIIKPDATEFPFISTVVPGLNPTDSSMAQMNKITSLPDIIPETILTDVISGKIPATNSSQNPLIPVNIASQNSQSNSILPVSNLATISQSSLIKLPSTTLEGQKIPIVSVPNKVHSLNLSEVEDLTVQINKNHLANNPSSVQVVGVQEPLGVDVPSPAQVADYISLLGIATTSRRPQSTSATTGIVTIPEDYEDETSTTELPEATEEIEDDVTTTTERDEDVEESTAGGDEGEDEPDENKLF